MFQHKSPISGVASYGQEMVATAGYDNRVILWKNHKPIAANYHDHLVNYCTFSPQGSQLLTTSSDYTARVWSLPNLTPVLQLVGHQDDVEMAQYSPQGERIATACRDTYIRIYDSKRGALLGILKGHQADVISIAWSSDGNFIFSSSDDGTVRKWCTKSLKEIGQLPMKGVETDSVVFTQNGLIMAGNDKGEIHIVNEDKVSSIQAHKAGIKRLVLSTDHSQLLSLSYDGRLCIFRIYEDMLIKTHSIPYPKVVWARSASFLSPSKIVFGTFGSTYAILDTETLSWTTSQISSTSGINFVTTVDQGLATIGDSGQVCYYELDDLNEQAVFSKELVHLKELGNFIISLKGELIVGGQGGKIYSGRDKQLIADLEQPLNCAFVHQGQLFVGGYTGELFIIVRESAQVVEVRRQSLLKNAIKSLAKNNKIGMAVGAAGDLCWFELCSGKVISYVEQAHDKIINSCTYVGHQTFASVSRDRKLKLWEVGNGQAQTIDTPLNHSIKCMAVDKDFQFLALGSYGGQTAIFDLKKYQWVVNNRPTYSGISSLIYCSQSQSFWAASYDGCLYSLPLKEIA